MHSGMTLYRAVVANASSTTGDITVRIPTLLGNSEVVDVSKIGREAVDGVWEVPSVGDQVIVSIEDSRFSNVYITYPPLVPKGNYLETNVFEGKGDVLTASAPDTPVRLPVGPNNSLLVADSTQTAGLKWASTLTGTTLTSAIIDSPTVNNGSINYGQLKSPHEVWNNVASWPVSSPFNVFALTSTNWRYAATATANWTLNFTGNGTTTLNSLLDTDESITFILVFTIGSTAYKPTAFSIDSVTVTPRWQGGMAPAGNINSDDVYTFSILKVGNQQFRVYASQTKFA